MRHPLNRNVFGAVLLACAVAAHAAPGDIGVVVPANKPPSRDAHFNWKFESANGQPVQSGQLACGSYWVAPAKGDDAVVFKSLTGHPEWNDLLSVDADPIPERLGLLSSEKTYGNYDASENLLPKLPATLTPPADSCISLVAAMQRNEAETSKGGTRAIVGNVADAYCVVTVLPDAPAHGGRNMIRPNITGTTKSMLTWDDFDLSRLPKYEFIGARSPDQWQHATIRWRHSIEAFGLASEVKDPRHGMVFTRFSEGARAFRAHLLTHDYASGMAAAFNQDVMSLFAADRDMATIKPTLAAMLAFGLDLYHARYDSGENARRVWTSGAGQSPGQFMPPVFAAALLKDQTRADQLRMVAITKHSPDPSQRGPQELRQIKRGRTGVLLWGDGHPIERDGNNMGALDWRYWTDFKHSFCYDGYVGENEPNANRGKKTAADPYGYIDGPANKPGSSYMGVALGPMRSFAAIMILMPDVRRVVNTDAPIEYTDRVYRHGLWTSPDPVAVPAPVDQDKGRVWYRIEGLDEWGKTWGVNPDDVRFAIEDGKGRFTSMHGQVLKGGYDSAVSRRHWEKIMAYYDGPTYEDRVVDLDTTVAPDIRFATGENPRAYLFGFNPDVKIHYTTDGSDPTTAGAVYAGDPIPVKPETVVKAIAVAPEKKASAVSSGKLPAGTE